MGGGIQSKHKTVRSYDDDQYVTIAVNPNTFKGSDYGLTHAYSKILVKKKKMPNRTQMLKETSSSYLPFTSKRARKSEDQDWRRHHTQNTLPPAEVPDADAAMHFYQDSPDEQHPSTSTTLEEHKSLQKRNISHHNNHGSSSYSYSLNNQSPQNPSLQMPFQENPAPSSPNCQSFEPSQMPFLDPLQSDTSNAPPDLTPEVQLEDDRVIHLNNITLKSLLPSSQSVQISKTALLNSSRPLPSLVPSNTSLSSPNPCSVSSTLTSTSSPSSSSSSSSPSSAATSLSPAGPLSSSSSCSSLHLPDERNRPDLQNLDTTQTCIFRHEATICTISITPNEDNILCRRKRNTLVRGQPKEQNCAKEFKDCNEIDETTPYYCGKSPVSSEVTTAIHDTTKSDNKHNSHKSHV